MLQQKWFRAILLSIGILLLLNVLHAFFLHQKKYDPVTVQFDAISNFDTFVWLTQQDKFSDSINRLPETLLKSNTSETISQTISATNGIKFLGIYWSNSEQGLLRIKNASFSVNGKTIPLENLHKFIDYTSANVTSAIEGETIVLSSNKAGNGWLMVDQSQLEDRSKQKQFLPFNWWVNLLLFPIMFFLLFWKFPQLKNKAELLRVPGFLLYRIRIWIFYLWFFLFPFWLQSSHIFLAVSMALTIAHFITRKEAFNFKKIKLFIPLIILFLAVCTIDVLLHPTDLGNDFGDYIYFLLVPFLFLGIKREDLRKAFWVFQVSVSVFVVLLSIACVARYMELDSSYMLTSFMFETVDQYWHTSYLAGLVLIALFFQLFNQRLTFWYLLVSFAAFVFIYGTQARLPLLIGLVMILFLTVLQLPRRFQKVYAMGVFILVMSGCVVVFSSDRVQNKLAKTFLVNDFNKADARPQLWQAGISIFKEHPVAGIGRSNIRAELSNNLGVSSDIKHRRYNAHNQYIEFLLAYGIVVPILFLVVLFVPIVAQYKTATIFLAYFIIAMMVESYLSRQAGVVFFSLFYSFFIYYDR